MTANRRRPTGPSTRRTRANRSAGRRKNTVARLRRRLAEAEETLEAIRAGHVEALVVQGPEGEQIYTLRSADQPYRLMVERMGEGALTLATDGTILYCNDRLGELLGIPCEAIIGRSLRDLVSAGEVPRLEQLLASDTFRGEFQLGTSPLTSSPVQMSSASLVIDGVRTTAVVVTDLTPERVERGLRESNRSKDEFLATLSHELRTPLNVILGWTQLLLGSQLPEGSRRHALELIERNAHAQAKLVEDLVDMSRVTTGKLRLDLEPVAVVPLLDTIVDSVRAAAADKGVGFETAWPDGALLVMADPTRLQQVFWNLLTNAVKFTPAGGGITVRAERQDQSVRIEVADTGSGIDPAFLPHVFDRFRQADRSSTRRQGGLGLGLAIVRDLVRLHGGDVAVHSDGHGRGSTFVVTLPAGVSDALAAPGDPRRPGDAAVLAGRRILLLEDHDDTREVMMRTLERAGASVASFGTVGDAIAALESVQPSVIVADIGLPGEDGHSFIRRVRGHARPEIRSIPAIAVSAYAAVRDRADVLASGFQRYLAKPVDPHRLVDSIQQIGRG